MTVGTWSTGATFGDYDGDGRLDLFVAGYAQIDLNNPPLRAPKVRISRFAGIVACTGDVRAARASGRARSSVSQQRRRVLYRRKQESWAWTRPAGSTGSAHCLPT